MAGTHARLAGRRPHDLCGSGGGSACVGGRLYGRCAVERRRSRKGLVRANQVAAHVPTAAHRDAGRETAVGDLRGPGLLGQAEQAAAIKAALIRMAREQGFDGLGVTRPDAAPQAKARLERFLADGQHGDMAWMAMTAARRGDPRVLWAQVRSIIMLGLNYAGPDHPLAILRRRQQGAISVYARGDDYHDVIKPRLKTIARWLLTQGGGDVKVFVDTAAAMEKTLAQG